MSTTYLCTTGTSIGQGTSILRDYQQRATDWEDDATDLRAAVEARLGDIDLDSAAGLARVSAEIHSLSRMGVGPGDRVVLLVTDTADGRVCAEAVARVLRERFSLAENAVSIERIPGLQVRNAELLRTEGLPTLVETALRYILDPQIRYGSEIVLNPTGGFKGVLPFLTVLGMLFRLRTIYLFEFADEVISLPPLPVSFDLRLYERALPAFERLQREGVVPADRFFSAIEGYREEERDLFSGFVEQDGEDVTLSTLATVLLEMDGGSRDRSVRVHPEIRKKWEQADPLYRADMERALIRVSHPLWRAMHGHRFHGTTLSVFGERSGPRIAGFLIDGIFHVTSLHLIHRDEHDAYERAVAGRSPTDFDPKMFTEWTPPSDLETVNADLLDAENARLESLARENADLKNKVRDQGQPYRERIRSLQETATEARKLRDERNRARNRNRELEKELERLRKELNSARKDLEEASGKAEGD